MRTILCPQTLQVKSISFKTLLISIIALMVFLLAGECLFRLEPIQALLPAPSIGQSNRYPELEIKLQRLNELVKSKQINCFLVGSSMVDAGLNPEILSPALADLNDKQYQCFNFGLSGAMVETSSTIVDLLVKIYSPELIILGTSAIEYDQAFTDTRDIIEIPWVQQKLGHPTVEGWVIDHSFLYRYLITLQKLKQPAYKSEYDAWDRLVNPYGFREWTNLSMNSDGLDKIMFSVFSLNPVDLDALVKITSVQNQGIDVVVVEMPVYPDFLPNYIKGGEPVYEAVFIQPVKTALLEQEVPFIRTQPVITSIVNEQGWYNINHLNIDGAKDLSSWLGQQIMPGGE